MTEPQRSLPWSVGVRAWLARGDQPVVGPDRADLLRAIARLRSISAAAREIGISYRHAWVLVQAMNEGAGEPLVESAVGGRRGGGARLTDQGQLALAAFERLDRDLHAAAAAALPGALRIPTDQLTCIHLSAAISLQEVVGQLLTDYALRQPAVQVRAVFGASNELADYILGGAPVDLFLSADELHLSRLADAGAVQPGARHPLAENSLSIVAAEPGKFRLRRAAEMLTDRIHRVVVAEPAAPLGRCTRDYLEGLGLYQRLAPKLVLVDNSRSVVTALDAGQATVGIVFSSDAARLDPRRIALAVRPRQASVEYYAALTRRGQAKAEAQALFDYLGSTDSARVFRRCGFLAPSEPAAPSGSRPSRTRSR